MTQVPQKNATRIIYLSQLFDPEPTFKGMEFIAGLHAQGMKVEVVTGFPNYPGGKLYDGYKIKPLQRDRIEATRITRLAMYPSHDRSALRRVLTYVSFMLTAFLYLAFRARKADLVYVYYPSLTAGLAAVAAGVFRRTPVIVDIQDMWPDSLGSSGMLRNRLLLWLTNAACNLLYQSCAHIIVSSPGFKALLVARGVAADKISVVLNWAAETPMPNGAVLPQAYDPADEFRVLYAGNMGVAQRLDTVLKAAMTLQSDQPGCVFYLMGDGVERAGLQAKVQQMKLLNVRFLPRVPLAEVQRFLAAADALLVHLHDDPLFRITIPSKTQACLYAGRPILMGVAGDAADLVRQADAGLVFPPGDALALAACVATLMKTSPDHRHRLGQNGHDFYMRRVRRQLGIAQTVDLINRFRREDISRVVHSGETT